MKMRLRTFLIILGFTVGLIAVASGAYFVTSNHVPYTGVGLVLTSNSTSGVAGVDSVRLIATWNPSSTGTVIFYDGATAISGSIVPVAGVATFDYAIPTAKTYDFNAIGNHP